MTPHIRPATAADVTAIEAIVDAAYAPYVPRIGRKPGPMLDDYAAFVAQDLVSVIELDGIVKGVLVLMPRDDAMLLDNIAVAPDAHGLGFGRRLLEHAEHAARNKGYAAIKLYTNEAMVENIQLYTRIGYVETHRAEEKGLRRVYMAKTLT